MFHGHEGRDEEGFVANLGEENHGEGKDIGMEWLDKPIVSFVFWKVDFGAGFTAWLRNVEMIFLCRAREWMREIVGLVWEVVGLLQVN